MITKRSIIVEIILVISLLVACIYGFLWMKRQVKPVFSSAIFSVVPPDALVVQRFNSFEDLCETYTSEKAILSRFCAPDNGLFRFLLEVYHSENKEYVFSRLSNAETVLSAHYTGKNNLHVLFGVHFNMFPEGEDAFERLCNGLGGATFYKNYNKVGVYQLFDESSPLYVAVTDGFLLAGTSPVVVEASVRHLVSGRSLMDNQVFASLVTLSSSTFESNVYVNVRQFDKMFLSLLGKRMQQYADFFSKSASWVALDATASGNFAHLKGYLLIDKGDADFFSTLNNQNPVPVKIWESVPSSTLALISFSLSDFVRYQNQYSNYLEIHKRDKHAAALVKAWETKMQTGLNEWFASLHPVETALAWIPVKSENQWVTIVRSSQIQQVRKFLNFPVLDAKQPPQVLPNPAAGAFAALFGSFFAKSGETHYTIVGNMLYFGTSEVLETLASGFGKGSSLYSVMREGSIRGKWMDESGLTCVLQGAQARDTLIGMWDGRYHSLIREALSPFDYALTVFQVASLGGKPYANLLFSADNLKQDGLSVGMPSKDAVDATPLPMNTGTFKIFNHASRKNEEIEQMPDGTLVLKDMSGKQVWRTKRKYAIVDRVVQIDFYNNDKLQMLFASEGTEVCLLDILGRLVPGFPKVLSTPVRKGPFLFDRHADKDYEFFLIHTDNSLRLYDKTGTEMEDFKPFIPDDRIEVPPRILTCKEAYYWLVFGVEKDYLLTSDGTVAVVLQKRNRIRQDAEIEIDENGVLQGVTTEGRILSVQLSSGTVKTRRP